MPSTEKADKGLYSQGCGFPLGHGWCESWTIVVQSFSCVELFATPWTACSMPGFPVHHHVPELVQTHVQWVSDATQPSRPLLSEEVMSSNCGASEDSWESLGQQEIEPLNLKGNQPWIIGRTDAEAETPVFWSFDAKRWLTGKVPDAGKDWGQRGRGHKRMRWLDGRHELGQTSGDGGGQRCLVCCSPSGHKQSAMTGWVNSSNN